MTSFIYAHFPNIEFHFFDTMAGMQSHKCLTTEWQVISTVTAAVTLSLHTMAAQRLICTALRKCCVIVCVCVLGGCNTAAVAS